MVEPVVSKTVFAPPRFASFRRGYFFFCVLWLTLPALVCAEPAPRAKAAKTTKAQTLSKEARERMKNREKLMVKARQRVSAVPPTPEQKKREAERRMADRAHNREMLAMHARWRPGRFGASDALWLPLPGEELVSELVSPKVEAALRNVVQRLRTQLGKPYVWGGQTPAQGFDCSGLVFYAYNPELSRKLPRTANGMFRDDSLRQIHLHGLRRGDLVFFSIKTRDAADHVGVYLGGGQFIEAPRTGLNIRVSQFTDKYWQDRFIGARRIITEEAIL